MIAVTFAFAAICVARTGPFGALCQRHCVCRLGQYDILLVGNASANRACHFQTMRWATNILGTFGYLVAVIAAFVTIYIAAQMARGFFAQD